MLRQEEDSWANPKVLAIFAVIFLCGVAFGAAVTRTYLHDRIRPPGQHVGMDAARRTGVNRLKRELNLTPAQERIVMRELDDYAKYYQNIEDERDDVAAHGKRHILEVLTPDQQTKFNSLYGQYER